MVLFRRRVHLFLQYLIIYIYKTRRIIDFLNCRETKREKKEYQKLEKGGIGLQETASKRRCKNHKKSTKVYEEGKGKRVICLEFKSDVSAAILIIIIIASCSDLVAFSFLFFGSLSTVFMVPNQKLKLERERRRSYLHLFESRMSFHIPLIGLIIKEPK